MRLFLTSLQFLTILPLSFKSSKKELGKSMLFFPLVGLLIGGMLGGVYGIAIKVFPHPVVITILLIVWIIITGALHLDGFADTLEGLYAGKNREERLKIMQDKYIGAIGTIGIVGILLLKYSLLLSLSSTYIFKTLLLTPTLSRWGMVVLATTSPYAREEGKAKAFVGGVKWWYALLQGLILVCISMWLLNLFNGISLLAGFSIFLWLATLFFQKRLGGVTGDALGAVNEIGEVLILMLMVLLL